MKRVIVTATMLVLDVIITQAACNGGASPGTSPAARPAITAPGASPSPGVTAAAVRIPADHAGRTTCSGCHQTGQGGPQFPANHLKLKDSLAVCQKCHPGP